MKNNDSAAQISSPKPSYHARRLASSMQPNSNPSPDELPQGKRVISTPEERETFDVPHLVQFF